MSVYSINPLTDRRWRDFVESREDATIFHSPAWLEALQRTYGYRPVVFTSTPPTKPIVSAIPFCEVRSWISGRRLVSLPFTDHCAPLLHSPCDFDEIGHYLKDELHRRRLRYIELRPPDSATLAGIRQIGFATGSEYCLSAIDLTAPLSEIESRFHKSCVQRRIRRAEKEGFAIAVGRSEQHLRQFYRLLIMTRRKHQLPPQPFAWFRNLADCLRDCMSVWLAACDGCVAAAIVTLRFGSSVVYKYGASDPALSHTGANALLFREAIRSAKELGATVFDMGRSDLDNESLIQFKERWGAVQRPLQYLRYPEPAPKQTRIPSATRVAKAAFARLPDPLLVLAGKLLYRHGG